MTGKRVLNFMTSTTFVAALILVLLLTNVQLAAFNNRSYYYRQYVNYQVPQNIGINVPDLMSATDILLDYMDGKRDNLNFQMSIKGVQQEFFSERDKLHMIDVKNLVIKGKLIRNIAFGYFLLISVLIYYITKDKQKRFSKLMIYTFVGGIIPVLLLAVLMNIDFYKYFTVFHEIFFNNDLWLLDPAKDRLINMYPEAFFSDIAFKIVFYYIGELLILLISGIFALNYKRRNIHAN